MSKSTEAKAVDIAVNEFILDSDIKDLYKVAGKVRKEILKSAWKFEGSMDNFTPPPLLSSLIKWILVGPNESFEGEKRVDGIERLISTVTQTIVQSVKSKRQVQYQPISQNTEMHSKKETPLNVGIGLYLHQVTRSKKLLDMMSGLNLSINYDKVQSIKTAVANTVMEKKQQRNGVFVPSILSEDQPIFFAIDNSDMQIDTVNGKDQLHGTAIAVFQQQILPREQATLVIERKKKKCQTDTTVYEKRICYEPVRENLEQKNYLDFVTTDVLQKYKNFDTVWVLLTCLCPIMSSQVQSKISLSSPHLGCL